MTEAAHHEGSSTWKRKRCQALEGLSGMRVQPGETREQQQLFGLRAAVADWPRAAPEHAPVLAGGVGLQESRQTWRPLSAAAGLLPMPSAPPHAPQQPRAEPARWLPRSGTGAPSAPPPARLAPPPPAEERLPPWHTQGKGRDDVCPSWHTQGRPTQGKGREGALSLGSRGHGHAA